GQHGAFRPYQHPATQQCLQDIMDGYFPSELQPRYPDGVPLQASATPSSWARWVLLGGPTEGGLRSVGCAGVSGPSSAHTHLLWLQGSDGQQSSEEMLLETPGLAALEGYRYKEAGAPGLCRLRVRSESGEQTYELRMLLTDTIGDLRQLLAHLRGGNSDYEIISTFPQRVYTDSSRSLQECGLVPRASLLLRRRDPPQGQASPAAPSGCCSPGQWGPSTGTLPAAHLGCGPAPPLCAGDTG
uniref:UBX domain-containing protein 11 n=1 Tax=Geospiza parvula TaxID=87175 RepID=A0A8C3ML32_GEOPR